MYAAKLIDQAKTHQGWKFDTELAAALGVDKTAVSSWKHGRGSPMPLERVIELCDLAGITEAERGEWLIGIERDAVTITSVRRALDVVLDRLRPTVAAVGLLVLAGAYALPAKSEPVAATYIMRTLARWLHRVIYNETPLYGAWSGWRLAGQRLVSRSREWIAPHQLDRVLWRVARFTRYD
jgi:transcriptional regulator with XRE-family HTH domain